MKEYSESKVITSCCYNHLGFFLLLYTERRGTQLLVLSSQRTPIFVFQVRISPSLKRQGEPLNATVTMFPHPPEGRGRGTVGRHGPGSPRDIENLGHYQMVS